jgi:hypothetical protein
LTSTHGALLEKQIDGFRRWNLDELRLVKRSEKKWQNMQHTTSATRRDTLR